MYRGRKAASKTARSHGKAIITAARRGESSGRAWAARLVEAASGPRPKRYGGSPWRIAPSVGPSHDMEAVLLATLQEPCRRTHQFTRRGRCNGVVSLKTGMRPRSWCNAWFGRVSDQEPHKAASEILKTKPPRNALAWVRPARTRDQCSKPRLDAFQQS